MNKISAFIIIAMLALAAACGSGGPPADWDKSPLTYRGSNGKLYESLLKDDGDRAMTFGDFKTGFNPTKVKSHKWTASDNGNWTLTFSDFNKKLNRDQTSSLRFFKSQDGSVVLAEMEVDGRDASFVIKPVILKIAKKLNKQLYQTSFVNTDGPPPGWAKNTVGFLKGGKFYTYVQKEKKLSLSPPLS